MNSMIILSFVVGVLFLFINIAAFSCIQAYKHKVDVKYSLTLLLIAGLFVVLMMIGFNVLYEAIEKMANVDSHDLLSLSVSTLLMVIFYVVVGTGAFRQTKDRISPLSIKESLEHMPVGLCYYTGEGQIHLANRKMIEVIRNIEGILYDNGHELKSVIMNRDNISLISDEMPILSINGRIYSFSFNDFELDGQMVHEIAAYDITDVYSTNLELNSENQRLARVNERLSALSESITATTIEKELLDAKMNIHDDLGEALLISRRYIENPDLEINKKELRELWSESVGMMFKVKDSHKRNKYDLMRNTAEDVGVKLLINGELPQDEESVHIISSVIHECLTNTIRHAKGDELRIDVNRTGRRCTLVFTNNGLKPKGEIKETGGLKSLRRMIEQSGGVMLVQSEPEFKLTVMLEGERA